MQIVTFKLLHPDANAPSRGTPESAGFDLHSYENVVIAAGKQALVATGVSVVIPEGHWGNLRMRSGAAVKKGLMINAGVIDSDYRGEIKMVLFNPTDVDVTIEKGERVCQMIVAPYYIGPVAYSTVQPDDDELKSAAHVGFGSTGSHGQRAEKMHASSAEHDEWFSATP